MGALILEPRTPKESYPRVRSALYEANASPTGADTVFDIATVGRRSMVGSRAPLPVFGIFRNRDQRPIKTVVTHILCGELEAAKKLQSEGVAL